MPTLSTISTALEEQRISELFQSVEGIPFVFIGTMFCQKVPQRINKTMERNAMGVVVGSCIHSFFPPMSSLI